MSSSQNKYKTNPPRPRSIGSIGGSVRRTESDPDSTMPTNTIACLPRPSLLTGLQSSSDTHRGGSNNNNHHQSIDMTSTMAASRPRRLWKVNDTSLRPIPPFYPPLDPRCTTFISDTPPSVVAVRIAECLRKRSVSVEYDEEAVIATAMTVDRCHFVVSLFRGKSNSRTMSQGKEEECLLPDFSQGVIVECMRVRGNTMSFHRACRAVLNAASANASGDEDMTMKPPRTLPPLEFSRLLNHHPPTHAYTAAAPPSMRALEALEHAVGLLRKDRLGAQQLGMESLVALTDVQSVGMETALFCSLAVVGAPICTGAEATLLQELHQKWIVTLLRDRLLPGEDEMLDQSVEEPLPPCPSFGDTTTNASPSAAMSNTGNGMDEHHGGILRAMALRCFCNALVLLAKQQCKLLKSVLMVQSSHLMDETFIKSLQDDLAGANRPPGVVAGTRLASVHEAVLAMKCLRILREHTVDSNPKAEDPFDSEMVLDHLEKARSVGKSTHVELECEAERIHFQLESARSC